MPTHVYTHILKLVSSVQSVHRCHQNFKLVGVPIGIRSTDLNSKEIEGRCSKLGKLRHVMKSLSQPVAVFGLGASTPLSAVIKGEYKYVNLTNVRKITVFDGQKWRVRSW